MPHLREYFRSIWPQFFVDDKHWPLFETLQFSAEAHTAAFYARVAAHDLGDMSSQLDVLTLLVVGSGDPYRAHMEWL